MTYKHVVTSKGWAACTQHRPSHKIQTSVILHYKKIRPCHHRVNPIGSDGMNTYHAHYNICLSIVFTHRLGKTGVVMQDLLINSLEAQHIVELLVCTKILVTRNLFIVAEQDQENISHIREIWVSGYMNYTFITDKGTTLQ